MLVRLLGMRRFSRDQTRRNSLNRQERYTQGHIEPLGALLLHHSQAIKVILRVAQTTRVHKMSRNI